jgi:hypothetical protein
LEAEQDLEEEFDLNEEIESSAGLLLRVTLREAGPGLVETLPLLFLDAGTGVDDVVGEKDDGSIWLLPEVPLLEAGPGLGFGNSG